ncbi:MAG: histidine--tRNA ligase [Elusimicrobia bacterium RIFOXYB2_FULL_49_7]|nr:MAG: histidine--tRNA ligase [Elusimicrobia bacterium RIFOXYB2_FULL_49_7]
MSLQAPKGTRDFYPEEMHLANHIFSVWRDTARLFGFEEYEGPIFEHLDLFTRKSGDEIVRQLYHFKDKSQRDLALRPEITPTLARFMVQKGPSLKKPVKWFSLPRLFRYERTQRGRLREFFQFNLDILGEPSVTADAELMAAVSAMLRAFGLSHQDFQIRVNSRRLMADLLESGGFSEEKRNKAYGVLDKRDKVSPDELAKMYAEAGISAAEQAYMDSIFTCQSFDEIKARFAGKAKEATLQEMDQLFKLVDWYGLSDCVRFDVSVIRGLAYYTGVVWEVFDAGRTLRAIAGGGRYDNLVELFGGEKTPAVGFGMGDVVLAELLREKGLLPAYRKNITAYVVNFNRESLEPAVTLAALLRKAGVSTEFALKAQNINKQLDAAKNAQWALFVGGIEWEQGEVKIKNMEKGVEMTVLKNRVVETISGK